jgi:hypothetical protein
MTTAESLSLADIPALLDNLRREKFYGRLSFDLRAGEVALIRTERTQVVSNSAGTNTHQGVNRDGIRSERSRS